MSSFEGRTVLITGGASGIGRETAVAFGERAASVVIGDVDVAGAEETAAAVEAAGGEAAVVEADVTADEDVARLVEVAAESDGGLDAAFNNAGISGRVEGGAPTGEYPDDAWDRVIDVNLSGVRRCLKHELARMEAGAVVNTASIAGLVGLEGSSAYVAAKHGVVGLTRTAALEYAPAVRVNAVCPGFTNTPLIRESVVEDPARRAEVEARHPMGRLGRPEEIAEAVVWLCSPASSFVTGHAFPVDGGYLSR